MPRNPKPVRLPLDPAVPTSPPAPATGGAVAAPPRRARRRIGVEGQRVAILAVSAQLLATKSYEQLSVEDILLAAGVSRQTFYRCFRNKNELFHTIFRDGNAMFLRAIAALDKTGADPATVMDRALTGAFLFVIHGGTMLRALYRETVKPDSEFAPYRKEVLETLVGDITGWSRATFSLDADPLLVRAVLLAVEQLIFEMTAVGTPDAEEIAHFRRVVRLLVEGAWREVERQARGT